MKPKEAQLLGVFAIIAAGIIVVSVLGGDGKGTDASSPVAPAPKIHVVRTGDMLIEISRTYYNTPTKWRIILEANKHLISAPEDLRPGMKLVIPAPPAPTPADAGAEGQAAVLSSRTITAGARSYDVEEGDTLWIIAEKVYNKPADWPKLMAANADILSDPKDLRPGMRLIVP